ncbi:MAG TPA: hypothetical protein DDY78_04900 [Planctomycetales bacterium]|nr:hypothetical protein [Planctomycetales bacterium]
MVFRCREPGPRPFYHSPPCHLSYAYKSPPKRTLFDELVDLSVNPSLALGAGGNPPYTL